MSALRWRMGKMARSGQDEVVASPDDPPEPGNPSSLAEEGALLKVPIEEIPAPQASQPATPTPEVPQVAESQMESTVDLQEEVYFLRAELQQAQSQRDQFVNKADKLENNRRWLERNVQELIVQASEMVKISEIVPVLDSLDAALAVEVESPKEALMRDRLIDTRNQILSILMIEDAEEYAEEDRKQPELADARNQADQVANQSETLLRNDEGDDR